jgi:hypothetical protein
MAGMLLLPLFLALFIAYFNFDFRFAFLDTPVAKDDGLFNFRNNNLTDEVAIIGSIASLFMIAFARLKNEDEYVMFLRLKSLQWGVYMNYAVFILLTATVYGGGYLSFMLYNAATILVLFIIIFNYELYIKPRFAKSELA